MINLLLAVSLLGSVQSAIDKTENVNQISIEKRFLEIKKVADGTFTDAAIIGLGSAFDVWATERCISRNPLCYEANELGKDSGAQRLALKAAVYPIKVGFCYFLRRTGHHNGARVAAFVISGVDTGLGIKNLANSRK